MPSKRASSPPVARPSKRIKITPKGKSKKAKRCDMRNIRERGSGSDENANRLGRGSGSDSSGVSEHDTESNIEYSVSLEDLKGAARIIARCCDLFCDVDKAIYLARLSKQEEQAANGESNSEDKDTCQARKEALSRVAPRVLARYKKVYSILTHEIPGIKVLLDDPLRASALKALLKKISKAMSQTRSSDSGQLRGRLPTYILRNPEVDTTNPPIIFCTEKSELGLNHVHTAGLLCPIESVAALSTNSEETRKKLEDGKINMSATELSAFLWEDNGVRYNDQDIHSGLFRGFYLERVARHIFTGPSTAYGGESTGGRSCNAALHRMEKVEAAHIAYAAVLARFGISSQPRWAEQDGCFNYRKFYYIIMDLIDECEDARWKELLLKHYNVLLFKNEEGRGNSLAADDEASSTSAESGGLLSRMRAQAAARATNTVNTPSASAQIVIPTPPRTSPLLRAVPEGANLLVSERAPSPDLPPSQQESPNANPILQPPQPGSSHHIPVATSHQLDVKFEEELARPSTVAKKPSACKGKQRAVG